MLQQKYVVFVKIKPTVCASKYTGVVTCSYMHLYTCYSPEYTYTHTHTHTHTQKHIYTTLIQRGINKDMWDMMEERVCVCVCVCVCKTERDTESHIHTQIYFNKQRDRKRERERQREACFT